MNPTIIVLLSGGQDSATCLFWARERWPGSPLLALSLRYGQRHAIEVDAANTVAGLGGCAEHHIRDVAPLGGSALTKTSRYAEIKGDGGYADHAVPNGLPTSFVPGRNALFLLMAAMFAVEQGARHIVTGVCQTDYSGYPDCRAEFIASMENTINLAMPSSCGPFQIYTPLMHLDKCETVKLARTLPGCWEALAHTVTCYEGERPGCGECPACVLRAKGFAAAGETDPARTQPHQISDAATFAEVFGSEPIDDAAGLAAAQRFFEHGNVPEESDA